MNVNRKQVLLVVAVAGAALAVRRITGVRFENAVGAPARAISVLRGPYGGSAEL